VGLAVVTGVPHTVWLEDPAAMATAYRHLQRIAEARQR
jgi:hypothetical protein